MRRISIRIGPLTLEAELNDTPTAQQIAAALPLRASLNTWGDEFYFAIPVQAELDDSAQEVVSVGDLGYWPPGKAFCIFFGLTPISEPGKIMPASAVNVVGKVLGDATRCKSVLRERQVVLEAQETSAGR
ncbi:MAG: cyclophilin-like fold protein [Candidatus Tectimicrobiota bacterium]